MQLLASWLDSIKIFKPSNFKLFSLVTINALLQLYKTWFAHWWFLIIGLLVFRSYMAPFVGVYSLALPFAHMDTTFTGIITLFPINYNDALRFYITYPLFWLVISTIYLSTRPSTGLKNYTYFFSFAGHWLYALVWFLLLPGLAHGFGKITGIYEIVPSSFAHIVFIVTSISTFFVLFLFDADRSLSAVLQALWNGIKMFIFNLPGWILLFILFFFINLVLGLLLLLVTAPLSFVIDQSLFAIVRNWLFIVFDLVVYAPLLICIATNYYVKRLHDQFQVYF